MSRAFFTAREVRVGPMIRSNSLRVEVWISFTMPVPMTTVPACTAGASLWSWSSRSARLLGTRTSRTSMRSGGASRTESMRTASGAAPLRARLASVARRVRYESVICTGLYAASTVARAPQRSPTTATVPDGRTGSLPSAPSSRRSRYSSAASHARNGSRGFSGKRARSNSPCDVVKRFILSSG